jgi:hypothetical protein
MKRTSMKTSKTSKPQTSDAQTDSSQVIGENGSQTVYNRDDTVHTSDLVLSDGPMENSDPPDSDNHRGTSLAELFKLKKLPTVSPLTKGKPKVATIRPLRKPNGPMFFRAHRDMSLEAAGIEFERDFYLIQEAVYEQLAPQYHRWFRPFIYAVCISALGDIFIWPIPVAGIDRPSSWHISAARCYEQAKTTWIQVISNMTLQGYEFYEPEVPLPEPDWGDEDFDSILTKALKGRIIDSYTHPVLLKLRNGVA